MLQDLVDPLDLWGHQEKGALRDQLVQLEGLVVPEPLEDQDQWERRGNLEKWARLDQQVRMGIRVQ